MKSNIHNILKLKLAEAKKLQEELAAAAKVKEASDVQSSGSVQGSSFAIAENENGTLKGEFVILETSEAESSLEDKSVQVTGQLNKDEVTFDHLNSEQKLAVTLGTSGRSFVLIGPAGSGKTTTQRVLLQELARSGKLGKRTTSTKSFHIGQPTVLITSFTKVATRNIKDAAPSSFKDSCINIHKAIEFSPTKVDREFIDEETGEPVKKEVTIFQPARNRHNPLGEITHCIVEEAGSVDTNLFLQLVDALPKNCIFIFLGDLNQIPPVYGAAILGFAISKLPVVELKTTYRQNVGPIKALAMDILEGKRLPAKHLESLAAESKEGAELILKPMSKKNDGNTLNKGIGDFMRKEVFAGNFIPGESVILCAIRKDESHLHNIVEMNRHIAQALSEQRNAQTFEIKSRSASGGTFYYAIGDLVFFEREYYEVIDITLNEKYVKLFGMDFKPESKTLNRWGVDKFASYHDIDFSGENEVVDGMVKDALDIGVDDLTETKNSISHHLKLRSFNQDPEDTYEMEIKTPGELNKIALGYAQTFHSAQGSEWRNVYISAPLATMFMMNREILYTGVTRARQRLVLFYEDGTKPYNFSSATFDAGIKRQAIKGQKLSDKVKYFKELYKKADYKYIPLLLDELNKHGTMTIEKYYTYSDDGRLEQM